MTREPGKAQNVNHEPDYEVVAYLARARRDVYCPDGINDATLTFRLRISSARQRVEGSWTESAGINRHIVGDERALRKRRSDSILASSLACELARDHSEA